MSRLSRRLLLGASAATLAAPALAQSAYPNKPVKIIVPNAAGGIADVSSRIVGERLSAALGQQFVIVNQPGPGGTLAAKAALAGGPDGYNLALISNGTAVAAAVVAKLGYDPAKDFTAVSQIGEFQFIVATAIDSPYKTLQELLADAKKKPGAINVGSTLFGTTQHLSVALLGLLAGVQLNHIPYKGSPDLVTGTIRGDVSLLIDGFPALQSSFDSKLLRALAVTGPKRVPFLPDVPTVAECGVTGYDVVSWNGFFVPTGTPPDIIALLNKHVNEAVKSPEIIKRFSEIGLEAAGSTSEAMNARLARDIARWTDVVQKAGVQRG